MATVTVQLLMEFEGFGNGWTDVSRDVRFLDGFQAKRGFAGATPRDRVAGTGVLSFALDNSEDNSAGALGYYSPGHANCRDGFAKHIGVQVRFTVGETTIVMWTGTLDRVRPTPGIYGERLVRCVAVDYMHQLARKRLSGLALLTDAADEDVFETIVAAVPVQPRALQVGTGFDALPYVFDTMRDERATATGELDRLCRSTLARVYTKGDGTLVYEPRNVRATNISENVVTLTGAEFLAFEDPPEIDDNADPEFNRYQVLLHPRVPDPDGEVVLYESAGVTRIDANIDVLIRGLYTEPGLRARRAGGLDMLPAEPYTDYEFNTAADGTGLDLTTAAQVDTIYTANSVLFTIRIPQSGYMRRLQARGIGIYDQANLVAEAEDTDSIALNGENAFSLDMPYQGDVVFGNEVAQYLLFVSKQNPRPPVRVPLQINGLPDDRALIVLEREISDRFGLEDQLTALPVGPRAGFFINAIEFRVEPTGAIWVIWTPEISDSTQYWRLGVVGQSELGFTTRLGFGLVVGHTDVAHADDHQDAEHADSAHVDTHDDVAHADAAHADSAHSDTHGDTAHSDGAHVDAHSDSAHADGPHADSHSDIAHADSHTDVAHVDTHTDIAHVDDHSDVLHLDSHGDEPDPHFDLHNDEPHVDDHSDTAHQDTHTDGAHSDTHGDGAHADTHNDVAHIDTAHGDAHTDSAHVDVAHGDTHSDAGHADAAHADVTHVDDHEDTAHQDTSHADSHGDSPHGDAN